MSCWLRAFTDPENLEKPGNLNSTSESQGKVGEACCVKLSFNQSARSNFENFLWVHTPRPLISLRLTVKFNRSLEKSGNLIPSGERKTCLLYLTAFNIYSMSSISI